MVRYICNASHYIADRPASFAILAKHIMPKENTFFQEWLQDTLRLLKAKFPCPYDVYNLNFEESEDFYDSSPEHPIPREFLFENDFDYEKNGLISCNSFLSKLDWKNNPYLCPSDEWK
ncbi:MAG: hypothetical protein FWG14_05080 [Peptococcaceae bacterium]|nr:hypothetical protein [Peptococcaceae bacterium]